MIGKVLRLHIPSVIEARAVLRIGFGGLCRRRRVDTDLRLPRVGQTQFVEFTGDDAAAVEGVVELRPALQSKEMFEAFSGLGSEGKTTSRGAPRNPLQLGATCWHFRHETRATAPPIWIQNVILPPLAALAKLFGVRPYHDRWDSRNTPSSERAK